MLEKVCSTARFEKVLRTAFSKRLLFFYKDRRNKSERPEVNARD